MTEKTVFYFSSGPINGISLPIKGTLDSSDYLNAGKGITKANLVKVEIGTDVKSIGVAAFKYCVQLKSVKIPDSVTSIGKSVFAFCSALESVTIPDSVTSIGVEAFRMCNRLTTLTIPDSVTIIRNFAFQDCSALQSVTIGDSVTSIGMHVFSGCEALTTLTIGKSVTSIGDNAFQKCKALTTLIIPDSVTSIGESAFQECSELTTVTLPTNDNFKTIGYYAFYNCISLRSVTIPDSVTRIGNYAFSGCNSLTKVTIGKSVTSIGIFAFRNCQSLTTLTIPDSVKTIGNNAFRDCKALTTLTIGDSVTSIGEQAFSRCSKLTTVTFNETSKVESIGTRAFRECKKLNTVTIPDSVTSIGDAAFLFCSKLTTVTLPNNVNFTSIGSQVFLSCSKLQSLTIPDSVTSIDFQAFRNCSGLTTLTIPDSVTSIDFQAFRNCSGLTTLTIPDSVTSIGEQAFQECSKLTTVTLPTNDNFKTIVKFAFAECTSLTTLTIPDSVTSIGIQAFSGCSKLQSVTIPDSVTSIGIQAFSKSGISSVTMGVATASQLDLTLNIKQEFFGQTNVYIECPGTLVQPGTISGTGSTLQNYNFDTGSEEVVIRLHVPGKRINEKDRSRMLIADFTNIEKKGGTEIRDIVWEKITDDGNTWENIDGQTKRAYTLTYPKTSTRFRVSCKYTLSGSESSVFSNPTFPLIGTQKDKDNIEQNVQKRDNYIEYKALNEFFNQTFTVTAQSINDENKYFISIFQQPTLTFYNGSTYRFESSIFKIHPFKFSTTYDGKHNEYTTNVTNGDDYVEITIDQDTPSTLYYYCENHENMGGKIIIKSENFNNTEFRKTLTSMFYDYPTISNTSLFENESFLYENMQEVEVSKRVRSITETPFPPGTRYYIHSITKYLEPTKYSWVNDTTKQLYFYTGNTTSLAKTRSGDGVKIDLPGSIFKLPSEATDSHAFIDIITNSYKDNKKEIDLVSIVDQGSTIYYKATRMPEGLQVNRKSISAPRESSYSTDGNRIIFPDGVVAVTESDIPLPTITRQSGENFFYEHAFVEGEFKRTMTIILTNGQNYRIELFGSKYNTIKTSSDDCFPGNSQLILKDGSKKIFHDIEVGDEIQVCSKDMELSYSKVIFLSHPYNKTMTHFVTITTKSKTQLHLTHNHYIPISNANNKLENVMARDVKITDRLFILQDNKIILDEIQNITETTQEGIYTCNTSSGEYIVVDNVVASPFIGDRDDLSYISKYVLSYNMTRIYAKALTMMDNVGLLFFAAPLLRFTNDVVTNILKIFRQ